MKRPATLVKSSLLVSAIVGTSGCYWGDRHRTPEELTVLPGLSVMEFDGLNVRIKRGPTGGADLVLLVDGQPVERAELRAGDRFRLVNGSGRNETYELLVVSADRFTLKKQQLIDRRAQREGIRTVESLIAVTPYNLEQTPGRRPLAPPQ